MPTESTNACSSEYTGSRRPHALDVVFQEVVHLVRTEEAEVAKLQCSTERPDEQPQECASDAQRSRGHGTQCGGRRTEPSRCSLSVQYDTQDGCQMGQAVPRRRCGWVARPLLTTSFIAEPNSPC